MTLVRLTNVNIDYGDLRALEDVDLCVCDGDFLGVVGPNGGGKTTLVKAMIGAVKYTGSITYGDELGGVGNEKRHGRDAGRRIVRRGGSVRQIGYLPQQNSFDPKFPISIREVVMSGLQPHIRKELITMTEVSSRTGIQGARVGKANPISRTTGESGYSSKNIDRVYQLIDMMGISDVADKPIGEVSGGQMQRALLCRSLISEPRLLILDEPANFVDDKFEKELYELLRELNRRMTIIMVSHDIAAVRAATDNIIHVNRRVTRCVP